MTTRRHAIFSPFLKGLRRARYSCRRAFLCSVRALHLTDPEWEAIRLSLRVAFFSVAGSLPFGIAVAWFLARRNFPGKSLVDGLIHVPLVVPPVVVGYGLLVLFG